MFVIPTRYILEQLIDNASKTILGWDWRNRKSVISEWANQISSLPVVPVSNSVTVPIGSLVFFCLGSQLNSVHSYHLWTVIGLVLFWLSENESDGRFSRRICKIFKTWNIRLRQRCLCHPDQYQLFSLSTSPTVCLQDQSSTCLNMSQRKQKVLNFLLALLHQKIFVNDL